MASNIGVSDEAIQTKRFHNASYEELLNAMRFPLLDIQLHTHRHQLPTNSDAIKWEVETNKNKLLDALSPSNPLVHFCYPSGIWSSEHLQDLQSLGIKTATTLDEGLNAKSDHSLKLKRNLVMDNRTLHHFIIITSGLLDVLRRIMGKARV